MNSGEPAPGLELVSIDDVWVGRDDILKAIAAVEGRPNNWIGPWLGGIDSPLAKTGYKGLADRYQHDHPEVEFPKSEPGKHAAVRRFAFIRLLGEKLDELDHRPRSPLDEELAAIAKQVALSKQLSGAHYESLAGAALRKPQLEKATARPGPLGRTLEQVPGAGTEGGLRHLTAAGLSQPGASSILRRHTQQGILREQGGGGGVRHRCSATRYSRFSTLNVDRHSDVTREGLAGFREDDPRGDAVPGVRSARVVPQGHHCPTSAATGGLG